METNKLIYTSFLFISIAGNPFYQMIAFFTCSNLGFGEYNGTNIYQADLGAFFVILVFIFLFRLLFYAIIFSSKEYPFLKGRNSFLYIFSERHLFQIIGLWTFSFWISPAERNVIVFFLFPLTVLLGSILSIITFIRLLRIKKILITRNKLD